MNALFVFASGEDLTTNHAKLMEFWRIEKEINEMDNTMSLKERFHNLKYSLLWCRAKQIIKDLK